MDRPERKSRYIDRLLERPFGSNLGHIIPAGQRERQIRRFLRDVSYESVLDIGCGTGRWAELARGRYLGIDTSPACIAACEERYVDDPLKQFILADAADFHPPVRYDLAIMIDVFGYLPDYEVGRVLEWVARSARFFFVLEPCPVAWNPVSRWLYARGGGMYVREAQEQEALLSQHPGLRLIRKKTYFGPGRLPRHLMFLLQGGGH